MVEFMRGSKLEQMLKAPAGQACPSPYSRAVCTGKADNGQFLFVSPK